MVQFEKLSNLTSFFPFDILVCNEDQQAQISQVCCTILYFIYSETMTVFKFIIKDIDFLACEAGLFHGRGNHLVLVAENNGSGYGVMSPIIRYGLNMMEEDKELCLSDIGDRVSSLKMPNCMEPPTKPNSLGLKSSATCTFSLVIIMVFEKQLCSFE